MRALHSTTSRRSLRAVVSPRAKSEETTHLHINEDDDGVSFASCASSSTKMITLELSSRFALQRYLYVVTFCYPPAQLVCIFRPSRIDIHTHTHSSRRTSTHTHTHQLLAWRGVRKEWFDSDLAAVGSSLQWNRRKFRVVAYSKRSTQRGQSGTRTSVNNLATFSVFFCGLCPLCAFPPPEGGEILRHFELIV